jgi:uncharacterized OsmC-like protein
LSDSPISTALQRVEKTFAQKPGLALQADAEARASLSGGLSLEVRHPAGHLVRTDMPSVLGGGGQEVAPGWLMRAGLASCTATVIAMRAERLGIKLTRLHVTASSHSDARGLLGLDPSVPAGPLDIALHVDVAAENADDARLADIVAWAQEHSPIGSALRRPIEVELTVNGKPSGLQ